MTAQTGLCWTWSEDRFSRVTAHLENQQEKKRIKILGKERRTDMIMELLTGT